MSGARCAQTWVLLTFFAHVDAFSVYMLGNSLMYWNGYTYFPLVQSLIATKIGVPTDVQSYTKSGATLQDMMVDMRAASGRDAPPQSALRNGQAWDAIVLQEQSAVPMWYNAAKDGPYDYTKYQNDLMFTTVSAKSMGSIIDAVTPQPHQIILHETWGYWTGNPDLPAAATYEGMQARVSAGYAAYRDLMAKRGTPVVVAPCGGAFAAVNNDTKMGKAVVTFKELYYGIDSNPDQKHPSKKGHYLAALALANTITQSCLSGPQFYVPESQAYDDSNPSLGQLSFPTAQQDYLQSVACTVTRNQAAASTG